MIMIIIFLNFTREHWKQGFITTENNYMYYPRFGYIPASNLGIQAPFDVPDDAFMVKQLVVNTDISGAVKYPNEFFVNE